MHNRPSLFIDNLDFWALPTCVLLPTWVLGPTVLPLGFTNLRAWVEATINLTLGSPILYSWVWITYRLDFGLYHPARLGLGLPTVLI